jgi:hypothetical protein
MKSKLIIFSIFLVVTQVSVGQDFKFGKVSKEELTEKSHPLHPDASAAVLYREHVSNYEYLLMEGFYMITEVFERVKIYNNDGYGYANKTINLYQGSNGSEEIMDLKAYTYFLDTNNKIQKVKLKSEGIFEEKTFDYLHRQILTMPDVKDGCVIELRYKLKSPFFSVDKFRLQEKIPINSLYAKLLVPEYFIYKAHKRGPTPFNIIKTSFTHTLEGGNTYVADSYEVKLTNVSAAEFEPYAGNLDNYIGSLKFELAQIKYPGSSIVNYLTTWEEVSKNLSEATYIEDELAKNSYFEEDIDNLLSGVSNPQDKMMAIYEFVKNKMTWNKVHSIYVNDGVRKAYKEGSGNVAEINLILTAAFRYAGIQANPVFLGTNDHGIPYSPTNNGFNYIISGVEVTDKVLLFDASFKDGEMNILQDKLLAWQGRIVREDGSSAWVPLIPDNHAVEMSMVTATIDDELSVNGTSKNRYIGHYAREKRAEYKSLSDDALRKKLESDKGEIELSNIDVQNLKTLHQPISLSYDFEESDVVENVGGKLYLSPMLFMGQKESPFKLDKREYPVKFDFPFKTRKIINITIPEGYTIESLPESTSFSLGQDSGSFRYQIKLNGQVIQLTTEMALNHTLIGTNEYEVLKGFYQLIVEKENEKVVLSKT